jgi:hypothetical protein
MYIVLAMKGAEDTEEEEINLSKYEETATEVRQPAHLIAALKELGFRSEFHPAGDNLVGYEGRERPERAQIVVRRDQIGAASNDIGFARNLTERLRLCSAGTTARLVSMRSGWPGSPTL